MSTSTKKVSAKERSRAAVTAAQAAPKPVVPKQSAAEMAADQEAAETAALETLQAVLDFDPTDPMLLVLSATFGRRKALLGRLVDKYVTLTYSYQDPFSLSISAQVRNATSWIEHKLDGAALEFLRPTAQPTDQDEFKVGDVLAFEAITGREEAYSWGFVRYLGTLSNGTLDIDPITTYGGGILDYLMEGLGEHYRLVRIDATLELRFREVWLEAVTEFLKTRPEINRAYNLDHAANGKVLLSTFRKLFEVVAKQFGGTTPLSTSETRYLEERLLQL